MIERTPHGVEVAPSPSMPAKFDTPVVLVARYAAAVGVDDAITTPFCPSERSMLLVVAASVRLPYIVVVAK